MEDLEGDLETSIQELRHDIEIGLRDLNPADDAELRDNLPVFKTSLQYSQDRDKTLQKLGTSSNAPQLTNSAKKFVQSFFKDPDLPYDVKSSLRDFHANEIESAKRYHSVIMSRNPKFNENYAEVLSSISNYMLDCSDTLKRLQSSTSTTYTADDVKLEIYINFMRRQSQQLLDEFGRKLKYIPLVKRNEVYTAAYDAIADELKTTANSEYVPIYVETYQELNEKLMNLTRIFNIDFDPEVQDSQPFLYQCQHIMEVLKQMCPIDELHFLKIDSPEHVKNPSLFMLNDTIHFTKVRIEPIFQKLIESFVDFRAEFVRETIKEQKQHIIIHLAHGQVRSSRRNLPETKLLSWLQLRVTRIRLLLYSLVSTLNIIELYKLEYLYGTKTGLTLEPTEFKSLNILLAGDKPVTLIQFKDSKLLNDIAIIGSYFIRCYEEEGKPMELVDRDELLEDILEQELRFENAKLSILESLIECFDHSRDQRIIEYAEVILDERPKFNLTKHKTVQSAYSQSISQMTLRANIIEKLIDIQISHERFVAARTSKLVPFHMRIGSLDVPKDYILFQHSTSISPFEMYPLLGEIPNMLKKISQQSLELCDFVSPLDSLYLETAILGEFYQIVNKQVTDGAFPFCKQASTLHFSPSDSVHSLLTSKFLISIDHIEHILKNMSEARHTRFLVALRRFYHLTEKLVDCIYKTDILMSVYIEQCGKMGITDRSTLLPPVKDNSRADGLNKNATIPSNDLTLDFAFTEFQTFNIEFDSNSFLKEMLLNNSLSTLRSLCKFQAFQVQLLKLAVEFNNNYGDIQTRNNYFLRYSDTFVTTTLPENSHILNAAEMLYGDLSLIKNEHEEANRLSLVLRLGIQEVKTEARNSLFTQIKEGSSLKEDRYIQELLDFFAHYAYRLVIAQYCREEMVLLKTQGYADVFVSGPVQGMELINEAGRFVNFFYIPTRIECLTMIANIPAQRQEAILKPLSEFIHIRLEIFKINRFECSLKFPTLTLFDSIQTKSFPYDNPVFERISNEIQRYPNSREVDSALEYLEIRFKYIRQRIEWGLLRTIEQAFISIVVSTDPSSRVIWSLYGCLGPFKALYRLYDAFIGEKRWMDSFFAFGGQFERAELFKQLGYVDTVVENAMEALKSTQFMDSFQMLQPSIDFELDGIVLSKLRMVFVVLLEHQFNGDEIFQPWKKLDSDEYTRGLSGFDNVVLSKVRKEIQGLHEDVTIMLAPKIEYSIANQKKIVEYLLMEIERLLVTDEIKEFNEKRKRFSVAISHLSRRSIADKKPSDQNFEKEMEYSIASLTNLAFNALDECTLERKSHDGTFSTLYDGKVLEKNLTKLSTTIKAFMDESCARQLRVWIQKMTEQIETKVHRDVISQTIDFYGFKQKHRLALTSKHEASQLLGDKIMVVNALESKQESLIRNIPNVDLDASKVIREEYSDLLSDLRAEIEARKSMFTVIRNATIDLIQVKIKKAGETTVSTKLSSRSGYSQTNLLASHDSDTLEALQKENSHLRKEISKARIIRCLSRLTTRQFFNKRIQTLVNDRKMAHQDKWESIFLYEIKEAESTKKLRESQDKLHKTEVEIEVLKQKLADEKESNIQLVQWKSLNTKKAENLQKEIDKLKGVGETNITQLLNRLDNARDLLDSLQSDVAEIGAGYGDNLRQTMTSTQKTRNARQRVMLTQPTPLDMDTTDIFSKRGESEQDIVARLKKESGELRKQNTALRAEIELIEKQRTQYSVGTIRKLETTVNVPTLSRSTTRKQVSRAIVRPFTAMRVSSRA